MNSQSINQVGVLQPLLQWSLRAPSNSGARASVAPVELRFRRTGSHLASTPGG